MLKYFYKTMLISFLCGSLLMLDFTYKSQSLGIQFNFAHAESVSTGGADDGGMAATLEMSAIGLVASRLFKYGKMTPDMMVAAVGGAAFVAGEILAYMKLKEAKKKIETSIQRGKNGDITDEQRQNILRLIEMYKAAKETAETKKMLQLAAAAAFAAAGIMAYFFTAQDTMAAYQCQVALTGGAQTVLNATAVECAALTAGTYTAAAGAICWENYNACQAALATSVSSYNAYLATRLPPEPSATQLPTVTTAGTTFTSSYAATNAACIGYTAGVVGAISTCSAVIPTHIINESGASAPITCQRSLPFEQYKKFFDINDLFKNNYTVESQKISSSFSFKEYFKNILIPTAKADLFSPMGIVSGIAITLVMAFSTTIATTVDLNILVPSRRGIIWGVMAAGAFAASSATASAIEQIEGDIQKLQNLLNGINQQATSNKASNALASNTTAASSTGITNSDVNLNGTNSDGTTTAGSDTKLPCITGDGANGKCESFSSAFNKLPLPANIPDAVKTNLELIGKVGEGLNNTSKISGSTLTSASTLASNANALKNALAQQKKAAMKALQDSGSSVDLDKQQKETEEALRKALEDSLAKNKLSLKEAYASLGGGFTSSNIGGTSAKDILGSDTSSSANSKKAVGPVAIPNSSLNLKNNYKLTDSLKDDEKKNENKGVAENGKSDTMDQYEMKNDITTDKGANIFDVISSRYQKSGYPRLFKRLNE